MTSPPPPTFENYPSEPASSAGQQDRAGLSPQPGSGHARRNLLVLAGFVVVGGLLTVGTFSSSPDLEEAEEFDPSFVELSDGAVRVFRGWSVTDRSDSSVRLVNGANRVLISYHGVSPNQIASLEARRLLDREAHELTQRGKVTTRDESTVKHQTVVAQLAGSVGGRNAQVEGTVTIRSDDLDALSVLVMLVDPVHRRIAQEAKSMRDQVLSEFRLF